MPRRIAALGIALCALLIEASSVRAQIPPPIAPPLQPPVPLSPTPAAPAPPTPPVETGLPQPAADPLTALMNRVTHLEDELRESSARESLRAVKAGTRPSLNWMMQIQIDDIFSGEDAAVRNAVGPIPDGFAFRRARFGMFGDYGPWEYKVSMDFALSGHPSFTDVYIGLNDVPVLGRVRAGYFFEPIGLEKSSQNRFITYLERSLPAEVLGTPRSPGILANANWAGQRGTWAAGMFRTVSDAFGNDSGDNFQSAGTGRVTYLLWYDHETQGRDLMHVGASYSARATKDDQVRFQARPEIRIGASDPNIPEFVDTGNIPANFYQLLNAELLLIRGPFSLQAEYQLMPVSTLDRGAVYFQTWYAMATLFLTGENRAYRLSTGVLDRVTPFRDFIKREGSGLAWGPGAWELAVRFSYLDLNNGGINGGRLNDLTFGVNWYLNPYVRMTANYIRAFQYPADGRNGAANFFGLRMGYDF